MTDNMIAVLDDDFPAGIDVDWEARQLIDIIVFCIHTQA